MRGSEFAMAFRHVQPHAGHADTNQGPKVNLTDPLGTLRDHDYEYTYSVINQGIFWTADRDNKYTSIPLAAMGQNARMGLCTSRSSAIRVQLHRSRVVTYLVHCFFYFTLIYLC